LTGFILLKRFMDTKRLILFVILSFSILMLWDAWQRQHAPLTPPTEIAHVADSSVPQTPQSAAGAPTGELPKETGFRLQTAQRITVQTDLFKAEIDTTGGDLRRLELLKHKATDSKPRSAAELDMRQRRPGG
jgi:YidC/Oxa1 family membrane protein insertase